MTSPTGDETEFTELIDADVPRVDLVDRAANGVPGFLVMKQEAGGLLDPAFVRELIAKSEPDHDSRETVTMTGSPGAIAKMIHEASARPVAKATEPDDAVDSLDPTVVLAESDGDAPGDPADPGSPAWEAIDAATACKWTAILARAKVALDVMAEREMLEAAKGDADDADAAWDLQDAACAIDYAISVLAPFAVGEQSESDVGAQAMAAVGKALAGLNPAALDVIEVLAPIRKAGRVLSTANEAAIRGAVEELQKVLASLPAAPQAPETTEEDGQPVAKQEETVPETRPTATLELPAEPVTKADPEKIPQIAVYDKNGKLVGIVDPASLVMIADTGDDDDPGDTADDAADEPDAAPDAAPETTDLTPAPAAEVGTSADAVPDDVTKQTDDTTNTPPDAVLKSIAKDAATAALADYSATQEQVIAKQADDLAQLADVVKSLKGQVEALEEQPAVPKVFTNGAVPPRDMLRGQDRGAAPVDVAKAQQMKKSLYGAVDANEQNRIANDMQADAITRLQEIHHGGAPQ